MRVLSLGAGVQSSAVLLMALEGELPPLDAAIFADTGWEPTAVYAWLERLEAIAAEAGVPVYRVSDGNIRDDALDAGHRFASMPVHVRRTDGEHAIARRQCTREYKVRPIRRRLRELMREAGAARAVQVFGISIDEVTRMRDPDVRYLEHAYPLVDAGLTRHDCERWLTARGYAPPRSACIGCPFHSDHEWRRLRDGDPDGWADAVAFDAAIRQGHRGGSTLDGTAYLHRSLVPLDEVDLATPEDRGQLTLDGWAEECAGVCGV